MTAEPQARRLLGPSIVAAVIGGIVIWMAISVVLRSAELVYPTGVVEVVIALAATVVTLLGLSGLFWVGRYDQILLSALTTVLITVGLASLLTIGVVLLLAAVVLVVVMARRIDRPDWRALASGVAIGIGLLFITWLYIQPPYVRCLEDGVEVSVPGDSSSGGGASEGGTFTGQVEFDGRRLSYVCRDGELVRFEITDR